MLGRYNLRQQYQSMSNGKYYLTFNISMDFLTIICCSNVLKHIIRIASITHTPVEVPKPPPPLAQ